MEERQKDRETERLRACKKMLPKFPTPIAAPSGIALASKTDLWFHVSQHNEAL
jgi:hypothetical protein